MPVIGNMSVGQEVIVERHFVKVVTTSGVHFVAADVDRAAAQTQCCPRQHVPVVGAVEEERVICGRPVEPADHVRRLICGKCDCRATLCRENSLNAHCPSWGQIHAEPPARAVPVSEHSHVGRQVAHGADPCLNDPHGRALEPPAHVHERRRRVSVSRRESNGISDAARHD